MLEEVTMLEDSIASCVLDETAAGVLLAVKLWLLETVLTEELADTAEIDCSVSIEASPPPKKNTRQTSPILQFFVNFIRSQNAKSAGIGSVRIKQIKKAIKAMCGCLNVPDIIIKQKKKMLKKIEEQPGFALGKSWLSISFKLPWLSGSEGNSKLSCSIWSWEFPEAFWREDLLEDDKLEVYEMPVPGMEAVDETFPFACLVTRKPFPPMLVLTPDLLAVNRTPPRFTLFRKRKPIDIPLFNVSTSRIWLFQICNRVIRFFFGKLFSIRRDKLISNCSRRHRHIVLIRFCLL